MFPGQFKQASVCAGTRKLSQVTFLQGYPLDSQQCSLTIARKAGGAAGLSWATVPVTFNQTDTFNLGSFALNGVRTENRCHYLKIILGLKRQIGFFVMQVSEPVTQVILVSLEHPSLHTTLVAFILHIFSTICPVSSWCCFPGSPSGLKWIQEIR